jgi:hypothetical protein
LPPFTEEEGERELELTLVGLLVERDEFDAFDVDDRCAIRKLLFCKTEKANDVPKK